MTSHDMRINRQFRHLFATKKEVEADASEFYANLLIEIEEDTGVISSYFYDSGLILPLKGQVRLYELDFSVVNEFVHSLFARQCSGRPPSN